MPGTTDARERPFEVAGVRRHLSRLSARAGTIMLGAQATSLGLSVVSTAVLARLLTPREFGLVAMAATLVGLVRAFRDLGLANAAVQQREITHRQASSAFWLNVRSSLLLTLAVAAMAPALAWFYGEPLLLPVTLTLSIGVPPLAASALHIGLLRRQMRFGSVAVVEVGAVGAGVVVGLASAYLGLGVWSLVLQTLTTDLAEAAGLWRACPWRPSAYRERLPASDGTVRTLRAFGRNVALSRLAEYIGRNADYALVGRVAGAGVLGLYEKAFQWAFLPFRQLYSPLQNVAVASFSRLHDDPARYRAAFRTALRALFAVALPAMAFLFVEAERVLLLFFGDQWAGAVPLFQILLVAAFVSGVGRVTRWVYLAEGRADRELRWTLISTPLVLLGVVLGLRGGARGIALGYTVAVSVLVLPALWYCFRDSSLRVRDAWAGVWRAAAAAMIAAVALAVTRDRLSLGSGAALDLCLRGAVYSAAYLLCFVVTSSGRRHFRDLLGLLRTMYAATGGGAIALEHVRDPAGDRGDAVEDVIQESEGGHAEGEPGPAPLGEPPQHRKVPRQHGERARRRHEEP